MDTTIEPTTEPKKSQVEWVKKINPKVLVAILIVVALGALVFYFKNLWIAATVNGHIISRWKVIQKLEKQNGKSVLDSLVDNELVNTEAKKNNISVSNSEVSDKENKLKTQVEAQGTSFEDALKQANLTEAELKDQISLQLKMEKLLGDKLNVTDAEIDQYIKDNNVPTDGDQTETRSQVRDTLKSNKFSDAIYAYLEELRSKAKINTYVNY